MRRSRRRSIFTFAAALLALQWSLTAQPFDTLRVGASAVEGQTPQTASPGKRPLSYDVVDYWKSIQGTRLSDDGQWLAYATTAQSEDGEVVVRNLRTGQEFKQARGTAPQFTPDAKFVVFTIAQPKADEEREAQATANAGGEEGQTGRGGRGNQRREPRTGLGIMSLPDGQVKTFEKVGSFKMPEKSSTWLAYYKGTGGGGGAGGRGGRGGGRGAPPAPGARGAGAAEGGTPKNFSIRSSAGSS